MPAALPVVVEVVAAPSPSEDLLRALVDSCSGAVGGQGCTSADADAGEVRARVTVRFADDLSHVHVELVRSSSAADVGAREADFHLGDPSVDRFRAAGLLAANLVLDHEREPRPEVTPPASPSTSARPPSAPPSSPPQAPSPPPPPSIAPAPPPPPEPPLGSPALSPPASPVTAEVAGTAVLAWMGERPWWAVAIAGDLGPRQSVFFGTASLLYGETWERSRAGISEQRFAGAAGGGARLPIAGPLSVRARVEVQLSDLRASIVQPGTGRTDAGDRRLLGVGADAALLVEVAGPVCIELGGRAAWLGGSTVVHVQGQPVTTIPAWAEGISLGLGLRFR